MKKIHTTTIFLFMINFNFHQHTVFSDGKETPDAYAVKAIEMGMSAIGFTEHAPLPFENPFSLKDKNVEQYVAAIDGLQERYKKQLEVFRALEMDYIPGISADFDYWRKKCRTDYLIGSVHLVKPDDSDELWFTDGPDFKIYDQGIHDLFHDDVQQAVKRFFWQTNQMITTQNFEIIGHFDKVKMHNRNRFFTDTEKWYRDLIDETVDLIKQKSLIVEINTRGLYKKRSDELFPGGYALQKVKELNLPIILSSDAHHPDELNMYFDQTVNFLAGMGFKEVMCLSGQGWKSRPLC